MNANQTRAAALGVLASFAMAAEGIRQVAYVDPPGILTVCYGSTTDVERGKVYSLEECRVRLDADMNEALDIVERCVPGLPVKPLAAFADATFNIGPKIVCNQAESTAARLLAAGEIEAACRELVKWDKAKILGVYVKLPGLSKRRRAEMTLCLDLV